MELDRLEKNLYDNILEAQVKLGYEGRPMSLNYTFSSLCHLAGAEKDKLEQTLSEFAEKVSPVFGDITFHTINGGYCITVPKEGTAYVYNDADGKEFIRAFIGLIRSHPSMEEVIGLFREYSDNVAVIDMVNDEFDKLVYFTDGKPDDYRYCLASEEEIDGSTHITYHRFIKEDYDELGF